MTVFRQENNRLPYLIGAALAVLLHLLLALVLKLGLTAQQIRQPALSPEVLLSLAAAETPPPAQQAPPAAPLAAVAAPAQSLVRSAGSMLSRRMLSTLVELPPDAAGDTRKA